jgi:hypothetical protein
MNEITNPSFLVVEDSDEDYAALERIVMRSKAGVPVRLPVPHRSTSILDRPDELAA